MIATADLKNRKLDPKKFRPGDALLVIDPEPTFMEGGGLAVAGGLAIVPHIVWLVLHWLYVHLIYATRDFHPWGHISLASSYLEYDSEGNEVGPVAPFTDITLKEVMEGKYRPAQHALFTYDNLVEYLKGCPNQTQRLWPDHGLFDTEEGKLHPDIPLSHFRLVFPKGTDPRHESNSAFKFNDGYTTGFTPLLKSHGVKRIFFIGYVFDVCVGMSGLDAANDGFEVVFIKDLTTSVSPEGDAEMVKKITVWNEFYRRTTGEDRITVVNLEDLLLPEDETN